MPARSRLSRGGPFKSRAATESVSRRLQRESHQPFSNYSVLMSTDPDTRIVESCLAGDREAFGLLMDKYEKKMYNTALRVVGDPEDAMDATQSAFVKAYEKLDTFNPSYRFFSWIYRILLNESLNIVNRRKRFDTLDSDIRVATANDVAPGFSPPVRFNRGAFLGEPPSVPVSAECADRARVGRAWLRHHFFFLQTFVPFVVSETQGEFTRLFIRYQAFEITS